jgi:N-acetyl-anhydromuramyl-L-alanine amidase AmpD
MRTISFIILHYSAVRPNQTSSAAQIDEWHKERVTKKGTHWKGIGYHAVIRRDGSIEPGRPVDEVGAHCYLHNRNSIGICYEGGLDEQGNPDDTRTPEQKKAMRELLEKLHQQYPNALIVGHRDLSPGLECPGFNAVSEYRDLQPW